MNRGNCFSMFILLAMLLALIFLIAPGDANAKTVKVNCTKGESINDAINKNLGNVIVEITGICNEDVIVSYDNVTLKGTDPNQDGIRGVGGVIGPGDVAGFAVVLARNCLNFKMENLSIIDGKHNGVRINDVNQADINNCKFLNNENYGVVSDSATFINNSTFASARGIAGFGTPAFLSCTNCTINATASSAVLANEGGVVILDGGSVSGPGFTVLSAAAGDLTITNGNITGTTTNAIPVICSGAFLSITGTTTIQATQYAIGVGDGGELAAGFGPGADNLTINGGVFASENSLVLLQDNIAQTINPSFINFVNSSASIHMGGSVGSRTLGSFDLSGFARLLLRNATTVNGTVDCETGGDFVLADATQVTGGISSQCSVYDATPLSAPVTFQKNGRPDEFLPDLKSLKRELRRSF